MALPTLLACLALAASLVMAFQHRPLAFPVLAVGASGLEVLMAFGVIHLSLKPVSIGLLLGAGLLVAGAVVHTKSSAKSVVSASTAVALVGALQVLTALHLR